MASAELQLSPKSSLNAGMASGEGWGTADGEKERDGGRGMIRRGRGCEEDGGYQKFVGQSA